MEATSRETNNDAFDFSPRDARLIDRYAEAFFIVDPDLCVRFINNKALRFSTLAKEVILGQPITLIYSPQAEDYLHEALIPAIQRAQGGETVEFRVWREVPGAGRRCLDLHIEPYISESSRIVGAALSIRDVTALVESEERAQLALMMFEHTAEGVIVLNATRRIRRVNPAFTSMMGYSNQEVFGESPAELLSAMGDATVYEEIWRTLEHQNTWRGEVIYRRRDGRMLTTWQTMVRISDSRDRPQHYLIVFVDLTEREVHQRQLERAVYYDALTGLPNRALLGDRATQAMGRALRNSSHVALLLVDLDRFKPINDSLGPTIGDQLLRDVARRLGLVLQPDATIGRYGADQFALLLADLVNPDQAATLAQRVLDILAEPHALPKQTLTVTASIGITVFPEDGSTQEVLTQRAETATQAAKRAGRNCFRFYTQDMNQRTAEHLMLDSHLRQGMAQGDLMLFYQPQVDLKSHRVVGMEALLRWRHPDLGWVPPSRFIPIAEESGLIKRLGEWVLRQACFQNKRWQDAGLLTAPIAVNVSALQFASRLDEMVAQALHDADLDPTWLELEVTESTLMVEVDEAVRLLRTLKQMGIHLAIDDFGTGYSSLSYLKRFPLDKLKVDRSFVTDLLEDIDDAAIAGAVVSLAKNLRLKVIAEGVETEGQRDFLAQMGCDEMQGFLVSPALPADEIPAFLRRWEAAPWTTGR